MDMPSLFRRVANSFRNRLRPTTAERWCADYFRARKSAPPPSRAPLVVVEAVEDIFFYSLHGVILDGLRKAHGIRVSRWAARSLNPGAYGTLRGLIASRLDRHLVSRRRWKRMYDLLCDEAGARADTWHMPWAELSYLWRTWRLFRGLTGIDQLAALTVDGVLVGDLVIDSYLRFRPSITVNIRDGYLFWVMRRALKDIAGTRAFFRREKPAVYLTTYSTYVQHGVPVRVAVEMGISTWSFANAQEFSTRLTPDHLLHTRRNAGYAAEFAAMDDQEAKLARADTLLGGRLSGVADVVTSTMRSAYQVRTHEVPDVRGAAVVFLHDFYDSPHIYSWMVFHDFWEWTCATVDILQQAGLPFFLKPHPSQRAESSRDLERLVLQYPGVRFLSTDISNRQLVDAGMACAVTVYGSVAAEMAYMGVPSITCSDNPHASFDAFHLAHDRAQYRALLLGFQNLPRDAQRLRRQACAFYYMHNLNNTPEELELRDRMFAFYAYLAPNDASFDPVRMEQLLADLERAAGFRDYIAILAGEL